MGQWSQDVTLKPGQHRVLRGAVLRSVRVSVQIDGESITLGTKRIRNGQTVRLRPDRYRVEVTSGGKVLRSGWIAIPRVTACTIREKPALDCYQ